MATFDGKPMQKPVMVAWFRREDYARIREISADRDNLPVQFDEWEKRINAQLAQLAVQGIVPDKFIVTPDALLAFAGKREINRKIRAEFAAVSISGKSDRARH